jgi:hypothetical protein
MVNKKKQLFILAVSIFIFVSCTKVLKHNEQIAASKANEFAKFGLIQRDYEKAAKLLPVERQSPASVKQIEELITKLHPSTYPSKVSATEYEPIFGQKALRIFLVGENNQNEQFYYSFVLIGTVDEGYNVTEVYRFPNGFPPSQMRKPIVMNN